MRRFCALADATRRTRYLCPSSFGGTSALLPEPDWRLASDHTRTAQKRRRRDSTLVGQPRGTYKKPPLLACRTTAPTQTISLNNFKKPPKQHPQTTLPPTNQPFIIMGGCGNSGCSCANCSCAPGACSCNVRSLLPTLTCYTYI